MAFVLFASLHSSRCNKICKNAEEITVEDVPLTLTDSEGHQLLGFGCAVSNLQKRSAMTHPHTLWRQAAHVYSVLCDILT